jgi:hypothetical protein
MELFCDVLIALYFSFGGQSYRQTCGVAMASPLSPLITSFYMMDFKDKALA